MADSEGAARTVLLWTKSHPAAGHDERAAVGPSEKRAGDEEDLYRLLFREQERAAFYTLNGEPVGHPPPCWTTKEGRHCPRGNRSEGKTSWRAGESAVPHR